MAEVLVIPGPRPAEVIVTTQRGVEVVTPVSQVPTPVVIMPGLTVTTSGPDLAAYEGTALEDIPVYSAVVAYQGGLWRADPGNEAHGGRLNGVAMASARAGERVRVALMGPLPGWGGAQGRLWVGSNGQPVTDAPAARWRQVIGFSVEPGVLIVQLKPVILSAQ